MDRFVQCARRPSPSQGEAPGGLAKTFHDTDTRNCFQTSNHSKFAVQFVWGGGAMIRPDPDFSPRKPPKEATESSPARKCWETGGQGTEPRRGDRNSTSTVRRDCVLSPLPGLARKRLV